MDHGVGRWVHLFLCLPKRLWHWILFLPEYLCGISLRNILFFWVHLSLVVLTRYLCVWWIGSVLFGEKNISAFVAGKNQLFFLSHLWIVPWRLNKCEIIKEHSCQGRRCGQARDASFGVDFRPSDFFRRVMSSARHSTPNIQSQAAFFHAVFGNDTVKGKEQISGDAYQCRSHHAESYETNEWKKDSKYPS